VALFSFVDSVHIYQLLPYNLVDEAMGVDSVSLSTLDVGETIRVSTRSGPYMLHLDVKKLDSSEYEVFGKGVERTRPVLLGSGLLGPVSNTIHRMIYNRLVRSRYSVGTRLAASDIRSMEVQ